MVTQQSPTPDTYHVAMKAFVRKDDKVLILMEADDVGKADLPGGRIAIGEFDVPLDDILAREIEEELGADVRYRNNGPVAIFRHRRPEITALGKPEVRVLMIGFELEYLGGEIKLSEEHTAYQWVPLAEAPSVLPGGQQEGMRKYLEHLKDRKLGY